jgi:uncharacterized protein (TIGR03066 family)
MRTLIGAVVVLAFSGFAAAQKDKDKDKDKLDAKKLVGKWQPADAKEQLTVEFTDKNKLVLAVELNGKSATIEGTYKLDGNKLEMVMSFAGKDQKETITISKLTDDEMVGTDSKGKTETLKRFKPKK